MKDPDRYIRKPDSIFERDASAADPIAAYWDSLLAGDDGARTDFIKRLAERGLVGFRRRIRARAGIFFVENKGGLDLHG